MQVNTTRTIKHHVDDAHLDYLGNSGTGVVEHGKQQMIAPRCPAVARVAKDGKNFLGREESEHWTLEAFHRHRQCSLDDVQGGHVAPARELT